MDTMTETLRGIARRLAEACAALPTVQAAALTGSAATGTADESSDIDLIVLHTALPERAVLNEIRARVSGSERLYSSSAQDTARFKEGYFVDGIRCDLSHLTLAALEGDLALVLNAHSTDADAQSRVGGIQHCLPLLNDSLLREFQNKAAHYPAALRRKMVEAHLHFPPFWVLTEMGAERGDLLFLYQTLVDAEKAILGVLCGLNGVYLPGDFKRVSLLADQLPLAPENLAARLNAILQLAPADAAEEVGTLIRETFALVELKMPEASTAWPRRWFELPRTGRHSGRDRHFQCRFPDSPGLSTSPASAPCHGARCRAFANNPWCSAGRATLCGPERTG